MSPFGKFPFDISCVLLFYLLRGIFGGRVLSCKALFSSYILRSPAGGGDSLMNNEQVCEKSLDTYEKCVTLLFVWQDRVH